MRKTLYIALTTILILSPVISWAADDTTAPDPSSSATTDQAASASNASQGYQFARQGVFGCNLTGSYAMSVGAMSAVGGVYVPVNDAAVTLNTGYLVYKECVLRGIVDRERESALAAMLKQVANTTLTGRDGNPTFLQNYNQELTDLKTKTALYSLQNRLGDLSPSVKGPVTQALAKSFMAEVADKKPTCSYQGDYKALVTGQTNDADFFSAFRASLDPNCVPIDVMMRKQSDLDAYIANARYQWEKQLDWGNGFYPVETTDANNNTIVLTPGILNSAVVQQSVTSGWRQTENANDVDQMIGALFAGLGTQIMSSSQGLNGLTQQIGTQPSYLNQVAAESAAGLRNSAANAAIQILSAALQVEQTYNQIVSSIANTLTGTIQQLRDTENQCWGLVVQSVCATPLTAQNTCTAKTTCTTQQVTNPNTGQVENQQVCPTGPTLQVATSTAFSQQVIQSQVTPLANQTVTNIQNSNKALTLINQLVSGVTNTTSVDAQRIALVQLDQLVSSQSLHNQTQLTSVQQQQAAIKDAMSTLIGDTKTAWGDSTDPNVGWCNVNSQSVVQMWIQRWTK
jgi:hypothetical protein